MKDFRGTYSFQPNGSINKGNGVKEQLEIDDCDCFTPFVKVHHFDCPLVKNPCPVHGEKVVRDANRCMFISFHPSLRNDNLFQPFQNLLTESYDNPFMKNQYCLQKNCKYIVKNRLVQTKSEDLKNFSNTYIVEKPKSFVADKTSKIKKLKQCFYSPCESVTQKSQSQTSIKEKISDIFWDKLKLTKEGSGLGNKELTQKSLDDMCLGPGSDNDYNSDGESPFQINKFSKIKVGINNVDQHLEGHQAKRKDLNDFAGRNLSFITPYIYYSSVSQESFPKINVNDQNIKNQHHSQTNTKDHKKDKPRRERHKEDSEASSISTKSSNSESSGSVLYTPIILLPKGMDKSSDHKIVVPSRELIDRVCQTSRKYLFREISASTQTAPKVDQCSCIERIKNIGLFPDGLLNGSPKNFNYANTQTSKHLINNNINMFADEGTPRLLSTYVSSKEHRGSIKSENGQRNGKETDRNPVFLKSEHKNEETELFDDEGTPKKLKSYQSPIGHNKRNERGSEDSKEIIKKNMTNGEVQSEDSTQSSDSSKSESNMYKYDYNKKNEIVVKRRNTFVGNHIGKKKEMRSDDSISSTSESLATQDTHSQTSKTSPIKIKDKLLDDEYYNVPHRPKSSSEWHKKLKVQNVNHAQAQATITPDVSLFPRGDLGDKNGTNKNQKFHAKNSADTPSSNLSKGTIVHNYRNDTDKFGKEENIIVSHPYEISPKHRSRSISKTSQLSKQSKLNNLNNVEEKFEKNNSNEKMSRLKSLAEGVTNWPNNMNQFKDPILQEIGKSQDYVLKNSENVAPTAAQYVSNDKSSHDEPVMYSASHAVPNRNKKIEVNQNLKSEDKSPKNKICMEEQLLNSLEEEILQWPDTMNFCKETLLEQIQKCRNSEAWTTSKEPSEFKDKSSQYQKIYDDDQSSQILDSYNFSEADKDKSKNNDESKREEVNYQEITHHLRTFSEEIRQLPPCEGSCKEQLLDWVRSQNVQNNSINATTSNLAEPKEKTAETSETIDDKETLLSPKASKKEIQNLHSLREESPEKEASQNELFDWARRSQNSLKKNEETSPLKSTETQILQPRDQAMEAEELPVKTDHENERCKGEGTPQKKIKCEEEAFLRILEEEISSCRNMIIRKIQQYKHLGSKSADMSSVKSLEDCNGKNITMKEIFCNEKISPTCGCSKASQKKKHRNQFVNPEEEYHHEKRVSPCNTEHMDPNKQEDEGNGRMPKDHAKKNNICEQVRQRLRGPIEIEENTFEIKKPYSYKATSICHTSIKFSTNSNKLTQTGEGEFTAVNVKKVKGSHTTYVLNSFSSSDSDENETIVSKCVFKSLSDGFIFEKKTGSANEVQLNQTCYCDPAHLKSSMPSNDSSKGINQIFDKTQYEEVSGDRKPLNKVGENAPSGQENNKTKKQQKPKECCCIKDQMECVPVADFSELYQLIHQRFDEMSSELNKICRCNKFSKLDLVDKTVMTDSMSTYNLLNEESPKQIVKREMPCEQQILDDLKNLDCDKIINSSICDKCTKKILSTIDIGTNTDITWSKPKTVEKGIVCEMNYEQKNETNLNENLSEKSIQRNNNQNASLESAKDVISPVSPKNRIASTKNSDASLSLPCQKDVESKAKPVNQKTEIKNNENKNQTEQTITKKIEVNCETLKKNTTITNCANQRSSPMPKPKPKRSPLSSRTRILDNSSSVTKKLNPETKTTTTKNIPISRPASTKPLLQPCTLHILDPPNCAQPSTSRQPQQNFKNFNQKRGCICAEINQQLHQTGNYEEQRLNMKVSASDYLNKEKNKLKKNSFMYHAQVLQPFLRIYNENLVAQFAEYCDTDYNCKLMDDFDSIKKLFPTSLKDFGKSKQKRSREKENSSCDDYPADKKSKIFEFGNENDKFDDEYYHSLTTQKVKENLFDLEKLGNKLAFYPSLSDPEFRIAEENRDIISNKFHKSEETLKKTSRQKIHGKRTVCLTEKILNNENCQRKSTGYLNCMNDQKQKLSNCRMCKSLTYLENADWRSILKFQEYLLIEKAKNDFNLIDKIFMFRLNSLNDDKCSLNSLGDN